MGFYHFLTGFLTLESESQRSREPPATVVETSIPLPVWSARRIRSGCGPRRFGEEAAGFKALESTRNFGETTPHNKWPKMNG